MCEHEQKLCPPRTNRINWNDYHMLQALVAAQRSPDPNTQVGACISDKRHRVLGLGYNGYPTGICVTHFNWAREGEQLETKYPYVVHAEKNAIYNANRSVEDAIVHVTMYPCNECAKDIIQSGIKEVRYLTNPYKDAWFTKAADRMFQALDIVTTQHKWDTTKISECLQNLAASIA